MLNSPSLGVSNVKRVILGIYFLSIAYCVVWIPWSITTTDRYGTERQRLGYGWLWGGPRYPRQGQYSVREIDKPPNTKPMFADVDDFVAEAAAREQWDATSRYAIPDVILVAFRIIAVTAVAGAAFILAGIAKPSAST
jgi:hypothetical protein